MKAKKSGGKTLILSERTGKPGASLVGDELQRSVSASKHFLKAPAGIAFETQVLRSAEKLGAKRVIVFDRDSGREYATPLQNFWVHGWAFD